MRDLDNGKYHLKYTLLKAGMYMMRVLVGADEIGGSPFVVVCRAGDIAASRCVPSGDGLYKARAREAATVKIVARDTDGHDIQRGGDHFTVRPPT